MGRAVWIGELGFGRVSIPVRLETVVSEKTVRAHLVHRKDHGRLEMKRFCRTCGEEVAWNDAARAVEIGNHEVVDFEPEELKALGQERQDQIAVLGFTEPDAVDPVWYDRAYAVVPVGKQPRAFELFAAALRDSGEIAVTTIVVSGKTHPAIVRPRGGELVLHTLHYGDEVREARAKPDAQLRPTAREAELGAKLVERMHLPFDPTSTEDAYRAAVDELAAGREPRPVDEAAARRKQLEEDAEVMDLMSALQKSLGEVPPAAHERRITTRKAAREGRSAGEGKTKRAATKSPRPKRAGGATGQRR